jgi:hypothetical protein
VVDGSPERPSGDEPPWRGNYSGQDGPAAAGSGAPGEVWPPVPGPPAAPALPPVHPPSGPPPLSGPGYPPSPSPPPPGWGPGPSPSSAGGAYPPPYPAPPAAGWPSPDAAPAPSPDAPYVPEGGYGYGQSPYGGNGYGDNGYGAAPGYPAYGVGDPTVYPGPQPVSYGYGWGYAQPKIEPMAIAGVVLGAFGLLCCFLTAPVGLGLGIAARARIRSSGGARTGEGWATAGIVAGALGIAWFVVQLVLQVSFFRFNLR